MFEYFHEAKNTKSSTRSTLKIICWIVGFFALFVSIPTLIGRLIFFAVVGFILSIILGRKDSRRKAQLKAEKQAVFTQAELLLMQSEDQREYKSLIEIDAMEGLEFEHWSAKMLQDLGYENVEVTRGSGDQGVDVLAEKDGVRYAFQCKCYSSNLGNTPVQEVNAGKAMYRCHVGVVITNQYFTSGAKELADVTGTLLWDRDKIKDYLATQEPPLAIDLTAQAAEEGTNLVYEPYAIASAIIFLTSGTVDAAALEQKLNIDSNSASEIMKILAACKIISQDNKVIIPQKQFSKMYT